MPQNISRRTIAKGVAWTGPAVAVAAAAPGAAASVVPGCSDASGATIDQAFANALSQAAAITSPLFEVSFYQGMDAADTYAQTIYVNVKNVSGTNQFISYNNRLAFTVNTYANATAPNNNTTRKGRALTGVVTSYGTYSANGGPTVPESIIAPVVQPGVRDATWVQAKDALEQSFAWTFYGRTVVPNEEVDMAIGFGGGGESSGGQVFRNPQYITVTPTNNPAVAMAPTFDSLAVDDACLPYYQQKLNEFDAATASMPVAQFIVNGPLSGPTTSAVGQTIDSRTTGNTVGGIQWGTNYNGIF